MKHTVLIALSTAIAGSAGQAVSAEVDMSKLTCKEVGAMSSAKAVGIAMWMNGYAHGKAGSVMLDGDKAEANAAKVADYCRKNPDATLAGAVEALATK
jgi:acid stress chaperone HdeB